MTKEEAVKDAWKERALRQGNESMILTAPEILELIESKNIKASAEQVQGTSLDVTLGPVVYVETRKEEPLENHEIRSRFELSKIPVISLRRAEAPTFTRVDLSTGPLVLLPGQFCLAQTREIFDLPRTISAQYHMRSTMGRVGMNHALAGWCDPGWGPSVLTLEFTNTLSHHAIELQLGDPAGQLVFHRHREVSESFSYKRRGRYNNDMEATPSKKVSE